MECVKVTLIGYKTVVFPMSHSQAKKWIENFESTDAYTINLVEMSQDEYDMLPELSSIPAESTTIARYAQNILSNIPPAEAEGGS